MIFTNSRYADQRVRPLAVGGEVRRTVTRRPPWRMSPQADNHVWTNVDRLDVMASRFFGDPTLWWKLADLNPQVLDMWRLQPGDVIKVPRSV